MALLRIENLHFGLTAEPLFSGLEMVLEPGERVCLVGRNGAGKSTLLALLLGERSPEQGTISFAPGVRVTRMSQAVPKGWQGRVIDIVMEGLGPIAAAFREHDEAAAALAGGEVAGAAMGRLERATEAIEQAGGWDVRRQVDEALSLLDLDGNARVEELSGGQLRRVALAQALASAPDLLILDEPTNHLDIPSMERLEELILRKVPTLLFVSHDRAFVERVATRIVELDRGLLHSYPGNWSTFLARREARLDEEERHAREFDKVLAEEEAWIRQGIKARRTRNEGRVRRLEELRRQHAARRERTGQAKMRIEEAARSGKLVFEAEELTFAYGDGPPQVKGFSATLLRGDRVGIIGPNGCGKSTLLKLLLGELQPSAGTIRQGTRLEIAYFDQLRAQLDEQARVWETIADGSDHVDVAGKRRHVLGYLRDFLFPADRARAPVRVLSGGERHRLLLARLFVRPSNLLVLDEPTNDLDLETLELLEDRLTDYEGTVLVVSHDRAFLNQVVTSTIAWEGEGRFVEYVGGYDDWLRQRPAPPMPTDSRERTKSPAPSDAGPGESAPRVRCRGRTGRAPLPGPCRRRSRRRSRGWGALSARAAASMRVCSFMVFSPALAAGSMPRRGARFHHFFGLVGQGAGAPASAYRPPGAPSTSPAIAAKAEKKKRGEKRAHGLARESGARNGR